MRRLPRPTALLVSLSVLTCVPASARAQAGRGGPQLPPVVSPEVGSDRRVTFRIRAPQAEAIRLTAGDIPGVGQATQLTKGETDVWSVTVGPIEPGAYRYNFNIDGVATIDPRNPDISESNNNVWSLVYVPGSDFMDLKDVPHGAVASVTYYSITLGAFRRMHVYTPPGYETRNDKYPVFYLLHGAGDSDHAWSSVGRAGIILDNLIAARKAKPMIVVMPAGHTRRNAPSPIARVGTEEFVKDFLTDVVPHVEKRYRVLTDRGNTAIAGLSMGGNHALHIAFPHLEKFGYVGIYSSGLLGAFPDSGRGRGAAPPAAPSATTTPPPVPPFPADDWVAMHKRKLDDPRLKKDLKLVWFGTGETDFLLQTTIATVDLLRKHGFSPVFKQTPGGHTWINWRNYLNEFAPQLFK